MTETKRKWKRRAKWHTFKPSFVKTWVLYVFVIYALFALVAAIFIGGFHLLGWLAQ